MRLQTNLADDLQNPKYIDRLPMMDFGPARKGIKEAHRIVLDDDACRLAVDLSDALPNDVTKMLKAARPMHDITWVEFSSRTMLQRRVQNGTMSNVYYDTDGTPNYVEERAERARTGMLLDLNGDNLYTNCIEHTEPPQYMMWPIGFLIALEGQPFLDLEEDTLLQQGKRVLFMHHKGKLSARKQANVIWGYQDAVDIKPLIGRAMASTHPSVVKYMDADMKATAIEELRGWCRLTVAVLSMLNSVTGFSQVSRQPGRRIVGNKTMPFLSTTTATVLVPRRIKKVLDYVRREIRKTGIRHRLHEVEPHYRHLTFKPSTPGWDEVEIEGTKYWRKRIDGHLRGDPELGVVEKTHTVLKGPK